MPKRIVRCIKLERHSHERRMRIALRITPDAERRVRGGHPWLYDQAIRRQSCEGRAGDWAVLYDRRDRFLAIGLYDPTSPIRVRILQHRRPALIDHAWLCQRMATAAQVRVPVAAHTSGYRMIHGENDGLPGLVVDRYDQTLVVKLYTPAWAPHLRMVLAALRQTCPAQRAVLRLSRSVQRNTTALDNLSDGDVVFGAPLNSSLVFLEYGVQFTVDPAHGQKTGFFLDQRENRLRVERLSAGRTVLDGFGYTGAFSVYAARGGACVVTTLDASRPALNAAARNMRLNRHHPAVAAARHELVEANVFEQLEQWRRSGRRFELIVLDPPAFAKTPAERPAALAAYHQLTRLALRILQPRGYVVLACCSSQITAPMLIHQVHRAAAQSHRPVRILEQTLQPLDHPIQFPEGAYLKCLFMQA